MFACDFIPAACHRHQLLTFIIHSMIRFAIAEVGLMINNHDERNSFSTDGSKSEIQFNPKEYMREIHPDLFSDTLSDNKYEITREVFSHTLDNLTSQRKDTDFEELSKYNILILSTFPAYKTLSG